MLCISALSQVFSGSPGPWSRFWNEFREDKMNAWYWIGGLVAAGLLVYLVIALMKPEIFS